MKQKIIDFHQDEVGDWVADLECGHTQHVRHDPPWQERPWVITSKGRQSRLGFELECKKCKESNEAHYRFGSKQSRGLFRSMASAPNWALRRAADEDTERLYALMCIPEVYRYLADGVVPPRAAVEHWIERSHADFAANDIGLWVLEEDHAGLAGCVRLETHMESCSAELTYVLHPQFWGLGLATRMSWTVMQHALQSGCVDQIVAGADQPNTASIAVMRRLGMTFRRSVQYPAGPGVEYVFRRGDPPPAQLPWTIVLRVARPS